MLGRCGVDKSTKPDKMTILRINFLILNSSLIPELKSFKKLSRTPVANWRQRKGHQANYKITHDYFHSAVGGV